jgi:2',3'-cyclic-nucleotide 2'-phosphodiesterase (5'-nucleotidase family)
MDDLRLRKATTSDKGQRGGKMRSRLLWLVLLLVTSPAWVESQNKDAIDLVILHINDTHGRLLPFETPDQKDVGGIARLTTLVKQIRQENAGRTLLLHAGDVFSRGVPLTAYYGGKVDLLAMECIGFDVVTPGNGEFYFGVENLMQQATLVRFPLVLANVIYPKTESSIFAPYVVKNIAGVNIAVLGLGVIAEQHPSSWPLILKSPIEVAKKQVPLLREKADVVLALTHIGLKADSALAVAVPDIDIIVGGHSHTRLNTPLRIPRPEGQGEVIVVQAGDYGQFLGQLDIQLRKRENRYRIIKAEGKLLPINQNIGEDNEIAKLLEQYSAPLKEVICISEIPLKNPPSGDSPLGNLVVEALRSEVRTEVALLDRGAVSGDIEAGEVTVEDIFRLHSWRNRVLGLTLTGSQIRQALTERDLLAAGCRFQRTKKGIESLEINGASVDSAQVYTVAIGEFLIWAVPSLRKIPFDETGYRVNTALYKYLRRVSVIRNSTSP